MSALIALFLAAMVAATLLPAQSEAVLVALILGGDFPLWQILTVATAGNVLGAAINWALGRFLVRHADKCWFPIAPAKLGRASAWYRRWGYWSLLGSWLPVIGDPLTFAAGLLREPLWRFLAIVTLAKGGRYVLLAWATLKITAGAA